MFDRSVAPNSLSIWTRHISGIQFHQSLQPKGCQSTVTYTAVKIAAGEVWGDIHKQAALLDLVGVGPVGELAP